MKFTPEILHASFSTARAARLTGLTPRQLDHWDREGFLHPSLATAQGYGSARRYSFADLVRLRVAARLRGAGFGLHQIRRAVQTLKRLDPSRGEALSARLLISGKKVLWVRSDREVIDVMQDGQLMLVFPVGREVASVAAAVRELGRQDAQEADVLPAPRLVGSPRR